MAKGKVIKAAPEGAAQVSVVVLKGKCLRHDGVEFRQNARLDLPESDAKRLIALGFVKAYTVLLQESQQVSDPVVSVTGTEGPLSIATSDPATPTPENGAD